MIITYANGETIKAALVVRTDNRLRVALEGCDDLVEFAQINGNTWVSEECEAVQIEFGFPKRHGSAHREEDFVCPQELAARLIHLLLNPEEDEVKALIPVQPIDSTDSLAVV